MHTFRFTMNSFKSAILPDLDEDFACDDDGDRDIILSKDELELLQVNYSLNGFGRRSTSA